MKLTENARPFRHAAKDFHVPDIALRGLPGLGPAQRNGLVRDVMVHRTPTPDDFIPQFSPVAGSEDKIRLDRPLAVKVPSGILWIREGFETDGASIPQLLWSVVGHPLRSKFLIPAIVHDFYCQVAWLSGDYPLRRHADTLFALLLVRQNVGFWHSTLMYWGVRANSIWNYLVCGRFRQEFID